MKLSSMFGIAALLFAGSSLFAATEARADVVKLRLKAEVSVPYLVVHPPQPIVRPRRITMHLVERERSYVRVFGHHHHRHRVRVGYHAPELLIRTRVVGPRIVGPRIAEPGVVIGGHIGLPGPPRVRGPRPSVVVIGGGGPPGHHKHPGKARGHGRGHGGKGHGKRH